MESYRAWLAGGTPEAADGYRQAEHAAVQAVVEAQIPVWEKVQGGHGGGLLVGLKEILANHLAP